MIEKMRQGPKEIFRKGDLVKLREGIDPEVLKIISEEFHPDIAYRVLYFEHHDDEKGDLVWLGPNDMSPKDVEDFHPEIAGPVDKRYADVLLIGTMFLRKVYH